MDDASSHAGSTESSTDLPIETADGYLQFTHPTQFGKYVSNLIKRESIKAMNGLTEDDMAALSQPLTRKAAYAVQPSQESDPQRLRTLLPNGTRMQRIFDVLLKLIPQPLGQTDWLSVADEFDPAEQILKPDKKAREQVKDAIYGINSKLKKHSIAQLFQWEESGITRLR